MNKGERGSLLFETFVAVMVLSIGIVAVLRIFSQALFVGNRHIERRQAQQDFNGLVFKWFANPRSPALTEDGNVTLPLGEGEGEGLLCTIESKKLEPDWDKSQPNPEVSVKKEGQYYAVKFKVGNGRADMIDMDGVVYSTKRQT